MATITCSEFNISAIEVVEEGRQAIEAPTSPTKVDLGPDGYLLGEFDMSSAHRWVHTSCVNLIDVGHDRYLET